MLGAVCDTPRALALPSPAIDCQRKWNWSLVPVMSDPPPVTVQVVPLNDCPPRWVGFPMSAQRHPLFGLPPQAIDAWFDCIVPTVVTSATTESVPETLLV